MKVAVMQPYLFPYIGYFQLINAVDVFVFYDDVDFIKNGWINRNRILLNGKSHYVTVPCIKASSNKLINSIQYDSTTKDYRKIVKTIKQAYSKAPYFDQVFPMMEQVFSTSSNRISALAQRSLVEVSDYLDLQTQFKISSVDFPESKGMDKADRLISICQANNATQYINAIGGKELYDKEYFQKKGIDLNFLSPNKIEYKQFGPDFTPWLSIIDVLMFNSIEDIKKHLNEYELL